MSHAQYTLTKIWNIVMFALQNQLFKVRHDRESDRKNIFNGIRTQVKTKGQSNKTSRELLFIG